ncbi:type II secretion system protein [Photobacterium phosphoreum]|uniref:type II secretion system protein n=1 Tax=Photobacterium phosphoreum TaxID=659 RepID=UPI000D16FD9B|nr:type II secretion system protein [Photobacterium phosphoreum]PSU66143.1 prepilin-type cleavage/methylation domain-containing protein [Photobacterium phosphoreum]
MARQQGFTLIELVMVIIVLAIISVTAASRYASKSSFSAELMRDQAISIGRQIQISAMQQQQLACATLTITESLFGCATQQNPTNYFTTANDQVTITPNYFLGFNLLGQPFNPQGERQCMTGSGCEITFTANNNNQAKMCINQQGYIHTGACL